MSTEITEDFRGARMENITKAYRMGDQEVRALAGVSAVFEPGSFWAVMGPSGSGKTFTELTEHRGTREGSDGADGR